MIFACYLFPCYAPTISVFLFFVPEPIHSMRSLDLWFSKTIRISLLTLGLILSEKTPHQIWYPWKHANFILNASAYMYTGTYLSIVLLRLSTHLSFILCSKMSLRYLHLISHDKTDIYFFWNDERIISRKITAQRMVWVFR